MTPTPPVIRWSLVTGLVAGLVQAAPVPPAAQAEAQLRAINHRFVDAFVVPDGDYMADLAATDFLLTDNDGSWVDRADFIARMRRPTGLAGASYRDVIVRLYNGVALIHGVFEGLNGEGEARRVRYTDVYAWDGAAWKLVSAQNTPFGDGTALAPVTATAPPHAGWQGVDPTGDDATVLRILNENYVRAFRESDIAWYDAHMSSDYLNVVGDATVYDKGAALAGFAEPTFRTHLARFPVGKVTIRRFGDVALIHAENDFEFKDGRRAVSRYTDIWHKQDGRWICIAAHITPYKNPA